jgi:hypothetical protein
MAVAKKIIFIAVIVSCTALGQSVDTRATVRQLLGAGAANSQTTPPPSAQMPTASAAVPAAISVKTEKSPESDNTDIEHKPGHRRDPFLSPISTGSAGPALPASNCNSGKRCLVVDQLVLRGVVKTATGMIAVVANTMNKAYFLHENDPVFNGYVVRITGDSVVFKENKVDRAGKTSVREVVKRVVPPPV